MSKHVVARYIDGRVLKGTSLDIDPNRPTFHLRSEQGTTEVRMDDLKALFFVRSLAGDPAREEQRRPNPADPRGRGSTIVSLRFADGEVIVGMTIAYPPKKAFFYVVPVDAGSNNVRILINRDAVVSMELVSS